MNQPNLIPRSHIDHAFDAYVKRQREAVEAYEFYLDLLAYQANDQDRLDRIEQGLDLLRGAIFQARMLNGYGFDTAEIGAILQCFDYITSVSDHNVPFCADQPIIGMNYYTAASLARRGFFIVKEHPSIQRVEFYLTERMISLLLTVAQVSLNP